MPETNQTRASPSPPQPKPQVFIAVMGLTGSGKSTFINLATQSEQKLSVGHSVTSCTSIVEAAPSFELDGCEVTLFDTPGFDDTNKSEAQILRIIAAELEAQYRKDMKLHGIIYIHRISDIRVGALAQSNFHIFRKICGDTTLKNVVIMTNMWSRATEEEAKRRVEELTTMDNFFKPAIAKGARMMHHTHDTVEDARRIIKTIMDNHPLVLSIQKEIVDQNLDIDKTSAGVEVDKKISELTKSYEKKLKEQLDAAEEARRERDEQSKQELLEESRKTQAAIEKLESDRRNQAEEYKRLQQQLAEMEAKRRWEADERERKYREQVEQLRKAQQASDARAKLDKEERLRRQMPTSGMRYSLHCSTGYVYAGDDNMCHSNRVYEKGTKQEWLFTRSGNYWTIKSVRAGRYLRVNDKWQTSHSPVQMVITPREGWCEFRIANADNSRGWNATVERRN